MSLHSDTSWLWANQSLHDGFSEWEIIAQLYHGENKLHFDNTMSAVHLTNRISCVVFFFIVLAIWNNSLWVDMSFHSDILSCFHANQSLLLLFKAACLVKKQQISII
jgi:hypothetical protein